MYAKSNDFYFFLLLKPAHYVCSVIQFKWIPLEFVCSTRFFFLAALDNFNAYFGRTILVISYRMLFVHKWYNVRKLLAFVLTPKIVQHKGLMHPICTILVVHSCVHKPKFLEPSQVIKQKPVVFQLCFRIKIRTKQWLVLGSSAV